MNINNLVKSAVFAAAAAGSACGDAYFNNYGSAGSAPAVNSDDAPRVICKQFVSCCHQVPDWTTQKVCLLHAGGNVDATVSDCMNHFKATYPEDVLECIAETFRCDPDPLGYSWHGQCDADIAAL